MELTGDRARDRWDALVQVAPRTVVGLDFDGTLAPIVDDPESAHIHRDAGDVLVALAAQVRAVAVITGRPARQVLDLGGLEEVGRSFADHGTELLVFGQYGHERWSSRETRVESPPPPEGLAAFEEALPGTLREHGADEAWVEDKGLAVAVHTRRLEDPQDAFERLLGPLRDLAGRHDLHVEPGKHVIEVRSSAVHKGTVVERLAETHDAGGFCFAGDDLGDLEAFEAVGRLAETMPTLRVCSASEEESALLDQADAVVDGPDGVLDLLRALTADAGRHAAG